ncbi:hypothetical protein PybrP1_004228, partial [[Pythium] brassicae (nom. inval.)]
THTFDFAKATEEARSKKQQDRILPLFSLDTIMSFELPKLTYNYNALEPFVDTDTMNIHHTKHHQAYINNINNYIATDKGAALKGKSILEVVQSATEAPAVLDVDDEPGLDELGPARRAEDSHRAGLWLARPAQAGVQRCGVDPLRLGLGVARREGGRLARDHVDAEPGQPADARRGPAADPDPRPRRLGARVLPQVPEPPPGVHLGVLERRQLGQGRGVLRQLRLEGQARGALNRWPPQRAPERVSPVSRACFPCECEPVRRS